MLIYILFYLSLGYIFLVTRNVGNPSDKKKILSVAYCTFLILILGLRHPTMGVDLKNYLPSFHILSSYSLQDAFALSSFLNYEKGFVLLNVLIGKINESEQLFLFVCAFLSIAPIGYVFYKKSDLIELSYIFYLGLTSFIICFSGLRQGIAIGICFFASLFVVERKVISFLLLVLLGSTFHTSSLLFLIAYPLYNLNLSKNGRIASIVLLPIAFVFKGSLFSSLCSIVGLYKSSVDDNGAWTLFVVYFLIYVFCCIFKTEDKLYNFYLNLFWVSCFIQAMGGVNLIVSRAGFYFAVFLPLLLPRALQSIKNDFAKMNIQIITMVCFILFGLYNIYATDFAKAYPYRFFWE